MKNISSYFCGFLISALFFLKPQISYATSMHHHQTKEIAASSQVPVLALSASIDAKSGINLKLLIKHYQLGAPGDNAINIYTDGKHLLQGHAHLFINGIKIGRLYGKDIHIPQHLLSTGDNTILVSLNSHQHHNWTLLGEPITSTLSLTLSDRQQIRIHGS